MRLLGLAQITFGLLTLASTLLPSCATEATGVEICRKIEYARCDAASSCPATFGAINAAECHRFYRDQCLHGLASGSDPKLADVNSCVSAIQALGSCAASGGLDEATLAQCTLAIPGQAWPPAADTAIKACALIAQPEAISACSFLDTTDAG